MTSTQPPIDPFFASEKDPIEELEIILKNLAERYIHNVDDPAEKKTQSPHESLEVGIRHLSEVTWLLENTSDILEPYVKRRFAVRSDVLRERQRLIEKEFSDRLDQPCVRRSIPLVGKRRLIRHIQLFRENSIFLYSVIHDNVVQRVRHKIQLEKEWRDLLDAKFREILSLDENIFDADEDALSNGSWSTSNDLFCGDSSLVY
ncbi:hypothetical protein ABKN59_003547 [Abortiporus biennis]